MGRDDDKVLVLGGGPAGATAALTLARAGIACRLLERSDGDTDKACGDFLSAEAIGRLDALAFPWDEAEARRVAVLRLEHGGWGSSVRLPFAARSVRRRFLDRWLLRAAGAAGARVELGIQARALRRVDNGFEVTSSAGLFFARRVILASGKLGVGQFHPRRPARGCALLGWKMDFRRLSAELARRLEDTLCLFPFAGGYGGISRVAGDTATVALVVQPEVFRQNPDGLGLVNALAPGVPLLAQLLAQSEPAWAKPITVANLPYGHCDDVASPGLFPVGDQFAVLPSFTGTGVSFAMASGAAAASCLARADGCADRYVAQARAVARSVLRYAMPLHRLLQSRRLSTLAVWGTARLPALTTFLARRTRLRDVPAEAA